MKFFKIATDIFTNNGIVKTAGGDCYSENGRRFMDMSILNGNDDIRLVHGEVVGQGPIEGVHYGHCWIEEGDNVIDYSNSREVRMPKHLYYTLGNIGDNVWTYDKQAFRKKVMEHEHWGPWDLITSSGM